MRGVHAGPDGPPTGAPNHGHTPTVFCTFARYSSRRSPLDDLGWHPGIRLRFTCHWPWLEKSITQCKKRGTSGFGSARSQPKWRTSRNPRLVVWRIFIATETDRSSRNTSLLQPSWRVSGFRSYRPDSSIGQSGGQSHRYRSGSGDAPFCAP